MFAFYLFILFWGIPTIFNLPNYKRDAFSDNPIIIHRETGVLDPQYVHYKSWEDYSPLPNPFKGDEDVWIWEVRNITTAEEAPSNKPAKLEEFSTNKPEKIEEPSIDLFYEFDYLPYKMPRDDSFEWKLFKTILQNNPNNVILSPVFVKLGLTILSETTAIASEAGKEWLKVLPDLDSYAVNRKTYKEILQSFKKESMYYNVSAGIKMYIDQRFEPRMRFLAIMNSNYNVEVEKLDFKNIDQSAQTINNWGAQLTAGHLKYLVNPEELRNSELLLLNAIYLDGLWTNPFPDRNTVQLPFFTPTFKQIKATFMTQLGDFYYVDSPQLNAKLLRLPLKGFKFSMMILLPNIKTSLDDVLRGMDNDGLKKMQWLMAPKKVKVSIPKFQIDYTEHLKGVLQSLGIKEVFTSKASLIGLAGRGQKVQLSDIIHRAGLIVSEKGCTGYEATGEVGYDIDVRAGSGIDEFNANRPFAFFIEDETTGVLFLAGKVTDPTQE